MATIELIKHILPHSNPEVNALEIAQVNGFRCVVKKEKNYKAGDKIVFIMPDYCLSKEQKWAEPYLKMAPERIRAIKLKGEFSEGLILSLDEVSQLLNEDQMQVGKDVSEVLGIKKFKSKKLPMNNLLAKSSQLPYHLPKTDEERWEKILNQLPMGEKVTVTLKIDGSSCSYGYKLDEKQDDFFVTSRSIHLKEEAKNAYTDHLHRYPIREKLKEYCQKHQVSLCFRGESYGCGIQTMKNNPHSALKDRAWSMFSVYDLTNRKYCNRESPHFFLKVAQELQLPHVPVLEDDVELTMDLIRKYSETLERLPNDGKMFEGVVIIHSKGSFKVINKYYDSKK